MQALNALIALDADVPSDDLMRLLPQHSAPVLILLAKNPQENKQALHSLITRQPSDEAWVAAHSLLISIKDNGLAYELLRSLEMQLIVNVVDSNKRDFLCGGSVLFRAELPARVRSEFPPAVVYQLSDKARRGDVLLAPGRHPIYYRRESSSSGATIPIDRNAYRYDFLAELMGTPLETLAIQPYVSETIHWTNPDAYLSAMVTFRDSAQKRFQLLLSRLREADVLTPSQAEGLKLQLNVRVIDIRDNKQPPLSREYPVEIR